MENQNAEIKHIKQIYKFKKRVKHIFIQYILFLIIFFVILLLIFNYKTITHKIGLNTVALFQKGINVFDNTISKIFLSDVDNVSDYESETVAAQNILNNLYNELVQEYKTLYGDDYEKYLKRDIVQKVSGKYEAKYGKSAEQYLKEDYQKNLEE
jgi:hypothetical protein